MQFLTQLQNTEGHLYSSDEVKAFKQKRKYRKYVDKANKSGAKLLGTAMTFIFFGAFCFGCILMEFAIVDIFQPFYSCITHLEKDGKDYYGKFEGLVNFVKGCQITFVALFWILGIIVGAFALPSSRLKGIFFYILYWFFFAVLEAMHIALCVMCSLHMSQSIQWITEYSKNDFETKCVNEGYMDDSNKPYQNLGVMGCGLFYSIFIIILLPCLHFNLTKYHKTTKKVKKVERKLKRKKGKEEKINIQMQSVQSNETPQGPQPLLEAQP